VRGREGGRDGGRVRGRERGRRGGWQIGTQRENEQVSKRERGVAENYKARDSVKRERASERGAAGERRYIYILTHPLPDYMKEHQRCIG